MRVRDPEAEACGRPAPEIPAYGVASGGDASMGSSLLEVRREPTPAQLALFRAGIPGTRFAEFHGCSPYWAYRVLRGEVRPPARFSRDLSRLLGIPEDELFPEGPR
jgi:hypothetical protein